MWAVLDLPAFAREGDEPASAADDLAGCALAVETLAALRFRDARARRPRALQPGRGDRPFWRAARGRGRLDPARGVRRLDRGEPEPPHVRAGDGAVVRTGDLMNTFSNEAERALRVAQERLALTDPDAARAPHRRHLRGARRSCAWAGSPPIALPNVNYHNAGAADRFLPEIVRLSDVRSAVAPLRRPRSPPRRTRRSRGGTTTGPCRTRSDASWTGCGARPSEDGRRHDRSPFEAASVSGSWARRGPAAVPGVVGTRASTHFRVLGQLPQYPFPKALDADPATCHYRGTLRRIRGRQTRPVKGPRRRPGWSDCIFGRGSFRLIEDALDGRGHG